MNQLMSPHVDPADLYLLTKAARSLEEPYVSFVMAKLRKVSKAAKWNSSSPYKIQGCRNNTFALL